MPTEAEVLLSKLPVNKLFKSLRKDRISTEQALLYFSAYLENIVNEHARKYNSKKPHNLIPSIYKSKYIFTNEIALSNYYRDTLCIAYTCFKDLIKRIYNGKPKITLHDIKPYQELIRSYIFDLKPYVEFFERKRDENYEMFNGGKVYTIYPFEFNKLSSSLFWESNLNNNELDKRIALNLSCFTLRQSLEIRFKKALGINRLRDSNHRDIKLNHDFFPNFIHANKDSFNLPDISFVSLMKIYSWTNKTIHSGISPKVWEVQYALKYVEPFFTPSEIKLENGKRVHSSVYGSIQIKDYQTLIDKLKREISLQLNHDKYIIDFATPEALIIN